MRPFSLGSWWNMVEARGGHVRSRRAKAKGRPARSFAGALTTLEQLEGRVVLSTFTTTSPTGGGQALPSGVTEVGGIVLDLVGTNGVRVVSQLPASSLYVGFSNDGTPV